MAAMPFPCTGILVGDFPKLSYNCIDRLLKKSSYTLDLAIQKLSSKYNKESIQTSLLSIQIDKYETSNWSQPVL